MTRGKTIREQRLGNRVAKKRTRRKAKPPKPMKESRSLAFIFLNAAGIATVGTLGFLLLFRTSIEQGAQVNPEVQSLIVTLSFALLFLLSLLVLTNKYMPKGWLASQEKRIASAARGYTPPQEKWGGALVPKTPRFDKVFDDKWAEHSPASLGEEVDTSTPFDVEPVAEVPTEPKTSETDDGPVPSDAADVIEEADTEESGVAEPQNTDSIEAEEPAVNEKMTEVLEHLKSVIVELTEILTSLGTKIDSSSKFGLNLYFAGACSRLSQAFKLNADEGRALLARLMELTGADKNAAHAFANNVNDYGELPRYRAMINAGDLAMACRLQDREHEGPNLRQLMEDWSNTEDGSNLPTVHTFMFTDLVEVNALTEQLGRLAMQKVIQNHDRTVRQALERFKGTEAKHTGDGILATFSAPTDAVNAALQIQQEIDLFNREKPDLAFEVRIGLHVGEAVMEGNEYVGSTVQKTARICAQADSDEIWVSDEIRAAYTEAQDLFIYCGEVSLKGLSERKKLFIADWSPIPDRINRKVDYQDIGTAS